MQLRMDIIDAFRGQLFKGNPAAVILLNEWLSCETMQSIAAENNLSETAFVKPEGKGGYAIRWFSPLTEIDFCGHATLASAFVLFERNPQLSQLNFTADAVGTLTVEKLADGAIEMSFPIRPPHPVENVPVALLSGLSEKPAYVLRSEQAYFAVFDNEHQVRALKAESQALKTLAPFDVVATAPGDEYDFVSRYFWPANGGDEDPVTGSIHAGLAPYWAGRLGKNTLHAFQASARGGELRCKVADGRVYVAGHAVRYLEGVITLP